MSLKKLWIHKYLKWFCIFNLKLCEKLWWKKLRIKISKLFSPPRGKRLSYHGERFPQGKRGLCSLGEKGNMFPYEERGYVRSWSKFMNVWVKITWGKIYTIGKLSKSRYLKWYWILNLRVQAKSYDKKKN